jgi:uncharacterized protein (DUF1330 family)
MPPGSGSCRPGPLSWRGVGFGSKIFFDPSKDGVAFLRGVFSPRAYFETSEEYTMSRHITLGLTLLAGVAIGAFAINGLNAQGKPAGAYAIVDITEITDQKTFDQIPSKTTPASLEALGGKYVIRTNNLTSLDGTAPKRFVVIAFDSVEKAKAWDNSPALKEINDLRKKSTKSRVFIADGAM